MAKKKVDQAQVDSLVDAGIPRSQAEERVGRLGQQNASNKARDRKKAAKK